MLPKTVAVGCENNTWSIEKYLFAAHSSDVWEVVAQIVARRNVANFTPFALLRLLTVNL